MKNEEIIMVFAVVLLVVAFMVTNTISEANDTAKTGIKVFVDRADDLQDRLQPILNPAATIGKNAKQQAQSAILRFKDAFSPTRTPKPSTPGQVVPTPPKS